MVSTQIQEYKKRHPEYKDIEEGKLATALYKKKYADKISEEEFYERINIKTGFTGKPQRVLDYEELDKKKKEILEKSAIPQIIPDPSEYIPGMKWLERAGGKAIRDIVSGVTTLPTDIYAWGAEKIGLPGAEKAAEFSEKLETSIPDVKVTSGQDIAATLIQYGLPAQAAWKIVDTAIKSKKAKALKDSLPVIKNLSGKPQKVLEYASKILGVTAADIVVTPGPEAETFGTVIGKGPTEIKTGDPNLIKRLKVGAETTVAAPAIDLAARGVIIPVVKGLKRGIIEPFTTKGQERALGTFLAEEAGIIKGSGKKQTVDFVKKDEIFKNIDESIELAKKTETAPTTGTGSRNVQLIAIEKALGAKGGKTTGRLFENKINNLQSLNRQLDDLLEDRVPSEDGFNFFRTEADRLKFEKLKLEQEKIVAESEVQDLIDAIATRYKFRDGSSASIELNKIVKERLKAITTRKNQLFDQIDPNNGVRVSKSPLLQGIKELSRKKSNLDLATPEFNNLEVVKKIKQAVKEPKYNKEGKLIEKGSPPLTYGALSDVRPSLSTEIAVARAANDGKLVDKLVKLKDTIERYTDVMAATGTQAGQRAKEALNYYNKVYVPRFQESIGRKFREAIRKDRAWEPSTTASKFLLGNKGGSTEAAENLSLIIKESESVTQANKAVDDYMHSLLARQVMEKNGRIIPRNVRQFQDNYSEVLKRFPDTESKFKEFYRAVTTGQKKVTDVEIKIKEQFDATKPNTIENQLSAAELMLNKSPVDAINNVMSSANPVKKMKEVLQLVNKDPSGEALEGIKKALKEWVWDAATARQARGLPLTDNAFELSRARISTMINNAKQRKALNLLFSPSEMKTLENVQKVLDTMDAINAQVTTGSPTRIIAENIKRVNIIMASYYGIVKGRGIFKITEFIAGKLGFRPKEIAEKLLTDAMLDPKLAKVMMENATKANIKSSDKFIRTYVTNNIITEGQPVTITEEVEEETNE